MTATELGTWETAIVSHIADMLGCPGRAANRRCADDSFWDKASMARSSATQRKQPSATGRVPSSSARAGTAALPSKADKCSATRWSTNESQSSNGRGLPHCLPNPSVLLNNHHCDPHRNDHLIAVWTNVRAIRKCEHDPQRTKRNHVRNLCPRDHDLAAHLGSP